MSFGKILAATDYSPSAQQAVDRAAHLARQFGAELRILHVVPEASLMDRLLRRDDATQSAMTRGAEAAMESLCERISRTFTVSPTWAITYGRASRGIADAQSTFAPDLLVIGTRGEGQSPFTGPMGGTSMKLLGTSKVPLLLVRTRVDDHYRKLLVALDYSAVSRRLLAAARAWAETGDYFIVHAFEAPFERRLRSMDVASSAIETYAREAEKEKARLIDDLVAGAGLRARLQRRLVHGDAESVLLREIADVKPDLVIIGKHGSGIDSVASGTGGTVLQVAFATKCDVLQVP